MSLLFALALLQSGPMVSPGAAPPIGEPPLRDEHTRRRRGGAAPSAAAVETSRLGGCLALAENDADAAMQAAQAWLDSTSGSQTAQPLLCLGSAQAGRADWDGAEHNFLAARDAAAASDHELRARAGAMAGNAALANAAPARALEELDGAAKDAAGGDPHVAGGIALDRARALVALGRPQDAATALATARADSPNDAQAWLLSATLSRRMGKLADAQTQIETAAQLLPVDPEIGLEAGVIAALAGHDEAARKSFASVIAAAPESPQATSARQYLAQLAPAAKPPIK